MRKGYYVAFEGGECCGKTTQAPLLAERLKKEFPDRKVVFTREPGGTPVSEAIRKILKEYPFTEGKMLPMTEAYLFAAARAQSLREVVEPVLGEGGIVVADRSVYSSVVYQGWARNLAAQFIFELNSPATGGGRLLPHKVVLIDLDVKEVLKRINARPNYDRFEQESEEFHQKIRQYYQTIAEVNPKIFIVIDGSLSIEAQAELIWSRLSPFLDRELRVEGGIRRERG